MVVLHMAILHVMAIPRADVASIRGRKSLLSIWFYFYFFLLLPTCVSKLTDIKTDRWSSSLYNEISSRLSFSLKSHTSSSATIFILTKIFRLSKWVLIFVLSIFRLVTIKKERVSNYSAGVNIEEKKSRLNFLSDCHRENDKFLLLLILLLPVRNIWIIASVNHMNLQEQSTL